MAVLETLRRAPRLASQAARVVGTGLAFGAFGVGGVLLAVTLFPLARRLPGTPQERALRPQRLIRHAFRVFVGLMRGLGLIRVSTRGLERLGEPGPRLVVANHPTLIDVVLLVAHMPQADCVVKREAWSNPFLRVVVDGVGYVPNDAGNALIEACVERLRAGRTLLLFPEGTRSPRGGLGVFHRGAAHIALRARCEILPVVIRCTPPTLGRGEPWYKVPERRVEFDLVAHDSIGPRGLGDKAPALAARELTASLREFFARELSHQGCALVAA
jgi:1-acyl-sn-glycerol-3-phosphate acyltransferase